MLTGTIVSACANNRWVSQNDCGQARGPEATDVRSNSTSRLRLVCQVSACRPSGANA